MLAPVSVQNPRLAVCAFALSLGVTLALAAPTSAQGLSIGWRDCRSGNGIGGTDEDPDCTPNFNPLSLFPAIRLASRVDRSEEHTSELQSPHVTSYAVFCLKQKKGTTA